MAVQAVGGAGSQWPGRLHHLLHTPLGLLQDCRLHRKVVNAKCKYAITNTIHSHGEYKNQFIGWDLEIDCLGWNSNPRHSTL